MVPRDLPSHENHPGATVSEKVLSRDIHFLRFPSPGMSGSPQGASRWKIAHPAFPDHPVQSAALNRVSVQLGTATLVVSDCRVCFALGSRWTGSLSSPAWVSAAGWTFQRPSTGHRRNKRLWACRSLHCGAALGQCSAPASSVGPVDTAATLASPLAIVALSCFLGDVDAMGCISTGDESSTVSHKRLSRDGRGG